MKYLLTMLSLTFSLQCTAEGYAGVWARGIETSTNFYSISQNDNQLMVAHLDTEQGDWRAYQGEFDSEGDGNTITLTSIYPYDRCSTLILEFTSDISANAQIYFFPCPSSPGPGDVYGYHFGIQKAF